MTENDTLIKIPTRTFFITILLLIFDLFGKEHDIYHGKQSSSSLHVCFVSFVLVVSYFNQIVLQQLVQICLRINTNFQLFSLAWFQSKQSRKSFDVFFYHINVKYGFGCSRQFLLFLFLFI